MVADARTAFSTTTANPHVRQIDPWRDGRAVANLLEASFQEEVIDDSGLRMIHSLRNYGMLDALAFGFGSGFVWIEDGEVIANASVQRNFTRKDTWIIGNVATHVAHRNRGIGRAVIEACIQYAASHRARHIALQADVNNKPALHLYQKIGFERLGEITHYFRSPVRVQSSAIEREGNVRKAKWSDRAAVWSLTQRNVPERFTFAESFERRAYQLGIRWSLTNALSGNLEQWLIGFTAPDATLVNTFPRLERPERCLIGAVRTRVNFEGSNHHLELMLSEGATASEGQSLVEHALQRFENYLSKPIYAMQTRLRDTADTGHAALQLAGFQTARTLVHMRLGIRD